MIIIRFCPLLSLAHAHRFPSNDPGNLRTRVMHIARDNSAFRADRDTCRFQSHFRTMSAIIALGRRLAIWINIERVIGACLHTRFTTDTATRIEVYNTIAAFIERPGRTNGHTGSIITVIAAVDQKITARIRELALLNILDPRAIDSNGHIMLGLARHCTSMAPNTLSLVNYKPIFRHRKFSSLTSIVNRRGKRLATNFKERPASRESYLTMQLFLCIVSLQPQPMLQMTFLFRSNNCRTESFYTKLLSGFKTEFRL